VVRGAYVARFKTTSAEPPPDAAGTVHVSSSPASIKGHCCSSPFQFGPDIRYTGAHLCAMICTLCALFIDKPLSRAPDLRRRMTLSNAFGRVVASTGIVLGVLMGLLYGTSSAAAGNIFYACAKSDGSINSASITVNTPPKCPGNSTVVSWFAAGPPRYTVTESIQIAANDSGFTHAHCNPGDIAASGGWQVQGISLGQNDVLVWMDQAALGPPDAPTSWAVGVKNISPNAVLLIVFADCLDLTP
jgi:hypothetical protein